MFNIFTKSKYKDYDEMSRQIVNYSSDLKRSNIDKDIFINKSVKQFLIFYDEYQSYLQKELKKNKSEKIKRKLYSHYIKINILYNNYNNYAFFMLNNMYYKSYEKQKSFLTNKTFENILNRYAKESGIKQLRISTTTKILFSILCFKEIQNIERQQIELDYHQYFNELSEEISKTKNSKNKRMFYLINALNSFINDDKDIAIIFLGYIYNIDKIKYKDNLHSIPLEYTGMGYNAYLTMPFSDNFKSFINENILDINLTNEELDTKLNLIENKDNNHKANTIIKTNTFK